MIRSMTGYCSIREPVGETDVLVEIKALNHKTFDFHFHATRSLAMLEIPFRDCLQQRISRGRIEVYLRGDGILAAESAILPNPTKAKMYLEAAKTISQELELEFHPRLDFFLAQTGVLESEESTCTAEDYWQLLHGTIAKAIDGVVSMKANEGTRLFEELQSVLIRIDTLNSEIKELRPIIINEYREKMMERITEWKATIDLDPNRIMQEIAFFTDRSDVQEETVRLKSHISQFHEMLKENSTNEMYKPVGRKMDFLCQEMFREVNTIGSKSSSIDIIRRVLDLKSAIDQLREQVQNVE